MLVGLDGMPLVKGLAQRSEVMEERVNRELGALDSLLHIKWIPLAVLLPDGRREGRYALASHWPQVDPRRQWVRDGEYDPEAAFDILGWFCTNMQDADTVPQEPEAILSKVMELLHKCDNTRFPWRQRMADTIEKNKKRQKKLVEESVDEIKDQAADQYYHSDRASRVFMHGGR